VVLAVPEGTGFHMEVGEHGEHPLQQRADGVVAGDVAVSMVSK
jgi:hypothetical protein